MKNVSRTEKLKDYEHLGDDEEISVGTIRGMRRKSDGRAIRIIEFDKIKLNESQIATIMQELESIMHLNHPSIVKLIGHRAENVEKKVPFSLIYEAHTKWFRLSEIIDDINIHSELSPMSPAQIANLIFGIAVGMKYLHEHKIVHQNLNPSSIYIDKDFRPHITNYGISILSEQDRLNSTNLNSLMYMAPEVLKSKESTMFSDVYSFATIIYRIMVHNTSLNVPSNMQTYIDNQKKGIRPILNNRFTAIMKSFISRCWSLHPESRPTFDEIVPLMVENQTHIIPSLNIDILNDYIEYFRDKGVEIPICQASKSDEDSTDMTRNFMIETKITNSLDKLAFSKKNKAIIIQMIKMQYLLLEITKENRKRIKRAFFIPIIINDKLVLKMIIRNIIQFSKIRAKKIDLYADLIRFFYSKKSSSNKLEKMPKYLIHEMFSVLKSTNPFPDQISTLALTSWLVKRNVFTPEYVVKKIESFYNKYSTRKKISCLMLFCWFAPELDEYNHELFDKIYAMFHEYSHNNSKPLECITIFMKKFEIYKKDNWSILYKSRSGHNSINAFSFMVKDDNIELIKKFAEEKAKDPDKEVINKRLNSDIFNPNILVHDKLTLQMYAALCGTYKCYLYLNTNGANQNARDKKMRTIAHYSAAGGNEKILSFIDPMRDTLDGTIHMAISWFNNQIFFNLKKMKRELLFNPDSGGVLPINTAAADNNLSILLYCLGKGVDYDETENFDVHLFFIGLLFI